VNENYKGLKYYTIKYGAVPTLIPDNAHLASVRLINIHRLERNFEKAWAEADAALKQFPDEREIKRLHALVLADLGRTDQALAEMRELLNGEKNRETHLDMASIYRRGKNYREMEKSLQRAEQLSQTKEELESVSLERADAYAFHMHKYEEAEAEYHKILKTNPENARALNNLGYMLAERNIRLEEARELISHAVKTSPQNGDYLDSLGLVYDRLGKLEEAETHFRHAWESAASDATISEHLGDVYFKKDKVKEAIVHWQEALHEYETRAPIDIEPAQVASIRKKLETVAHP
jgi:tetratricopeptide (TPR) repeat protein